MAHDPNPQYLISPTPFAFRALARLTGTLPLGQGREQAVVVLLAARLASSALGPGPRPLGLAKRAAAAKAWLPAACPERRVRHAAVGLCSAVEADDPAQTRSAVEALLEAAAPWLTAAARAEVTAITKRPRG